MTGHDCSQFQDFCEMRFSAVGLKKNKKNGEHRDAPLLTFLFQELVSYLVEPLISAFSVAPRARAYFLPAKRTWEIEALPLL